MFFAIGAVITKTCWCLILKWWQFVIQEFARVGIEIKVEILILRPEGCAVFKGLLRALVFHDGPQVIFALVVEVYAVDHVAAGEVAGVTLGRILYILPIRRLCMTHRAAAQIIVVVPAGPSR